MLTKGRVLLLCAPWILLFCDFARRRLASAAGASPAPALGDYQNDDRRHHQPHYDFLPTHTSHPLSMSYPGFVEFRTQLCVLSAYAVTTAAVQLAIIANRSFRGATPDIFARNPSLGGGMLCGLWPSRPAVGPKVRGQNRQIEWLFETDGVVGGCGGGVVRPGHGPDHYDAGIARAGVGNDGL